MTNVKKILIFKFSRAVFGAKNENKLLVFFVSGLSPVCLLFVSCFTWLNIQSNIFFVVFDNFFSMGPKKKERIAKKADGEKSQIPTREGLAKLFNKRVEDIPLSSVKDLQNTEVSFIGSNSQKATPALNSCISPVVIVDEIEPLQAPKRKMNVDEAINYLDTMPDVDDASFHDDTDEESLNDELPQVLQEIDHVMEDMDDDELMSMLSLPDTVNDEIAGDDGGSYPGGFISYTGWDKYRAKYLPKAIGHIFCRDGKIFCDTCRKFQNFVKLTDGKNNLKGMSKSSAFIDGITTQSTRYCNKAVNRHCDSSFHTSCVTLMKSQRKGKLFDSVSIFHLNISQILCELCLRKVLNARMN